MIPSSHRHFRAGCTSCGRHIRVVGGDYHSIGGLHGRDALPNPDNQWFSAQEAERFLGESGGPQPGWDYDEGAHKATLGGGSGDAKSTPRNIGPGSAGRKDFG